MNNQVVINQIHKLRSAALICLLTLLCQSLICQNINKSTPVILDLEKALSRQEEVPLSRFVKSVVFIPLETNPQSIIGINPLVEVTDEYISSVVPALALSLPHALRPSPFALRPLPSARPSLELGYAKPARQFLRCKNPPPTPPGRGAT